jgi:hypothetical protein
MEGDDFLDDQDLVEIQLDGIPTPKHQKTLPCSKIVGNNMRFHKSKLGQYRQHVPFMERPVSRAIGSLKDVLSLTQCPSSTAQKPTVVPTETKNDLNDEDFVTLIMDSEEDLLPDPPIPLATPKKTPVPVHSK